MIAIKTQWNQNQILNPLKKIASPKQKTQPKKMKLKNDLKKSMEGQRNIKEAFRNFTENRDIITKNDEMNDNNEDKILMRKNNDSNKESRVYIFGKESGISSEEIMEASLLLIFSVATAFAGKNFLIETKDGKQFHCPFLL